MSFSVDVNLLVYASHKQSPFYQAASSFLADCARGTELFCLTWPTLLSYVRIATHPSIFSKPLSPQQATENVERLLALPQVRILVEQNGFWELYQQITSGMVVRGNLVPDAQLVTVLKQHDVAKLYTNDRDFLKFHSIKVLNPLK